MTITSSAVRFIGFHNTSNYMGEVKVDANTIFASAHDLAVFLTKKTPVYGMMEADQIRKDLKALENDKSGETAIKILESNRVKFEKVEPEQDSSKKELLAQLDSAPKTSGSDKKDDFSKNLRNAFASGKGF